MELLIAFATDNGKNFNDDHFGMAKYYQIYRFCDDGEEFVEQRENVKFQEDESKKHGDPAKAQATATVLSGIDVLVSKKFGPNITRMVKRTNVITDAIKIVKNHMDEVIEEKNKTKDRRHLVFKQ
jgi:predicted Fe-Mo cluster-binding NifX family protein